MDPSQIDQILANLVVNARDAMAGKNGQIFIKTENTVLTEEYCSTHPDVIPKEYLCLTVTDSGCGMDEDTLTKIFEPFFTTKPPGKGTGMGLATVFGIVKQNEGHINVRSELGKGTTFEIYLPRYAQGRPVGASSSTSSDLKTGKETIFLVEDDESISILGKALLEKLGYTVLVSTNPSRAVKLFEGYPGVIDLLITDVVMPDTNGRELYESLQALKPDLKCLYMSGYPADVIANKGVLETGLHFMSKPFTIKNLSEKVREVLDQ